MGTPDLNECDNAADDGAKHTDHAEADYGSAKRDDRGTIPITAAPMERPLVGARRVRHGYSPLRPRCPPVSSECRLHLVEEAINLLCVISLVDGSSSESDSANLISGQVITHLHTRRDNAEEGIDLVHPMDVVPGGWT